METEGIIYLAHVYALMRHPEESKGAFLELVKRKNIGEEYALSYLFNRTGISYKHSSERIIEEHLDVIFPKMQEKPYTVLRVLTHKDAEKVVGSLFKSAYDSRDLSDQISLILNEEELFVVSSYGVIVSDTMEIILNKYIAVNPLEIIQISSEIREEDISVIVGKILREKAGITEKYFSIIERMNAALKEGSFDDFLNSREQDEDKEIKPMFDVGLNA